MSKIVNFELKDKRKMMDDLLATPLNAKLNDSGYYTFDETPSLTRNRLASTPNSLYYLTPDVTSFTKDDFVASPLSQPDVCVPRFQLPLHEDADPESVPKTYPRKQFASNTEIGLAFALPIVPCHSCGKDGCHHGDDATLRIPRKKHSIALVPVPGQEIGETHIDFFRELVHSYNCPIIVNRILSYLTGKDLRSVCCVSRKWREACQSDSFSNAARLKEVERLKKKFPNIEKENEVYAKRQSVLQPNYTRGPFGRNIVNVVNTGKQSHMQKKELVTSNATLVPSRFQLFQEEAKKLLPCERLQPCPRCTSPSRIDTYQKRGFCSRVVCAYDFCINCSCQYHDSLPCPVFSKPRFTQKGLIGTKSSRRNLKRL